jgi:hypothetical protein
MRVVFVAFVAAALLASCGSQQDTTPLKELRRVKVGMLDVVLLSPGDALQRGKGTFALEFRDAGGALVDVGTVTVGASMPMPGMAPMFGECTVMPTSTKGRYGVASDLGMAGTWRLQIVWDGPAGRGSVSMPGAAL